MSLTLALLTLLAGFILLVIGGDALVKAAISLAVKTKIPAAIISLTIIAAGTSAPELITSLVAAFDGVPDIAVGNVIGSNIFNILAIIGISFLLLPPQESSEKLKLEGGTLFLATIATFAFCYDLLFTRIEGITFLVLFITFTVLLIKKVKKQNYVPDEEESIAKLKNIYLDFLYLTIGFVGLIAGANLALKGGISLGQLAGLSDKVIGITIISIGTGLPELAASTMAAIKGRNDIAIGNIVGSNIMNTLLVLGGTSTIIPLPVNSEIMRIDIWILIIITLLFVPVMVGNKFVFNKKFGGFFLLLYVGYLYGSVTNWAFLAQLI